MMVKVCPKCRCAVPPAPGHALGLPADLVCEPLWAFSADTPAAEPVAGQCPHKDCQPGVSIRHPEVLHVSALCLPQRKGVYTTMYRCNVQPWCQGVSPKCMLMLLEVSRGGCN